MATYQKILDQLSGDSLKEYSSAVKYLCDTYRDGKLDFPLDQQIMERAAAVYIFEQWSGWVEMEEMINKVMDVLPEHTYLFEDFNDRHMLGGLGVFFEGLNNRTIDISGFLWPQGNAVWYAAYECNLLADKIEAKNPAHAATMRECHATLTLIEDTKVDMYYLINAIETGWTKEMADAIFNIITKADSEGISRLIGGLSFANTDSVVIDLVMNRYFGVLEDVRKSYEEQGKAEQAEAAEKMIKALKKRFLDEDEDDADVDEDEDAEDDE